MAPIELDTNVSYIPAAILSTHLLTIGFASVVALRSIYRSYIALPPSSATRHREPLRKGHVQTFSLLALLSLGVAGFYAARFGSLSYRVWATERGVELPDSIFGDRGALRGGHHPGRLQLVRWLHDTTFYQDSLEIVAERARSFWWGQQVNLGLVCWSLYLAIEGQRRNISNLWAFLALSQLVGLSFAQNLFFVAVLLTPVPLPENVRDLTRSSVPVTSTRYSKFLRKILPAKPDGFLPHISLYISLLLANFTAIFLIPYAVNTPSFMLISAISRSIPFAFFLLPYLTPNSWGRIHTDPHSAHHSYTTLFRITSTISTLLHLKSSTLALSYNIPSSTYHRHSLLHPFRGEEYHRSPLNRGSAALSRVFGAILEHPAVGFQGWDVILTGLSLGLWAAVRGLDGEGMLGSVVPFGYPGGTNVGAMDKIKEGIKTDPTISTTSSPSPRRRLPRATRSSRSNNDSDNPLHDPTYHPTAQTERDTSQGDEDIDAEDWEAGALAWGLLGVGGLGVGAAAVLGGWIR